MTLHPYRTHMCGELRLPHAGSTVRLSGWVHRKRDHGGVLFIDLRDNDGITQVVITPDRAIYDAASDLHVETVVCFTGQVVPRTPDTVNPKLSTGEVEVVAETMQVLGPADILPFPVADDTPVSETIRLTYRFLDLRRQRLHKNIILRSRVIASIRRRMMEMGFHEFQTPILTSSSPEGARDYLVPSRLYPGKFYALPQAPQQFKQLLMVAGFDRYFQIAPCFRDEDSRADRSPGEFYQLDLEMSFVEQEDVFRVVETLFVGLFPECSDWSVNPPPFPRIPYADAMCRYGSDKPDLRFGLEIVDVTGVFRDAEFVAFRRVVDAGGVVRLIPVPDVAGRPRSFFDSLEAFVKELGGQGLAYLVFTDSGVKGPIARALGADTLARLSDAVPPQLGAGWLFVADEEPVARTILGRLRLHLADLLDLRTPNAYRFCWIVDFPMYEFDDEQQRIVFSHNPFSMPQGGLEALTTQSPLDILAYQYDIVCNGVELSSGAIRNHHPDIMYKAFEIAGYSNEEVGQKFGGMIRAFRYGAPPHGGIAPGIDRIVMLLAHEENLREVIAFPMNQNAQDLLMDAPNSVTEEQLRALHIQVRQPTS